MNNRKSFSEKTKRIVFNKLENNSLLNDQKKKDFRGKVIHWTQYGKSDGVFGWNIDHIDHNKDNNDIENLRAVHYETHKELNDEFNSKKI